MASFSAVILAVSAAAMRSRAAASTSVLPRSASATCCCAASRTSAFVCISNFDLFFGRRVCVSLCQRERRDLLLRRRLRRPRSFLTGDCFLLLALALQKLDRRGTLLPDRFDRRRALALRLLQHDPARSRRSGPAPPRTAPSSARSPPRWPRDRGFQSEPGPARPFRWGWAGHRQGHRAPLRWICGWEGLNEGWGEAMTRFLYRKT